MIPHEWLWRDRFPELRVGDGVIVNIFGKNRKATLSSFGKNGDCFNFFFKIKNPTTNKIQQYYLSTDNFIKTVKKRERKKEE